MLPCGLSLLPAAAASLLLDWLARTFKGHQQGGCWLAGVLSRGKRNPPYCEREKTTWITMTEKQCETCSHMYVCVQSNSKFLAKSKQEGKGEEKRECNESYCYQGANHCKKEEKRKRKGSVDYPEALRSSLLVNKNAMNKKTLDRCLLSDTDCDVLGGVRRDRSYATRVNFLLCELDDWISRASGSLTLLTNYILYNTNTLLRIFSPSLGHTHNS